MYSDLLTQIRERSRDLTATVSDYLHQPGIKGRKLRRTSKHHIHAQAPSPLVIAGSAFGLALLIKALVDQSRRVDLRGKTVLITGGTRGLGYLLAKEFAKEGCRIALCGRDNQEVTRVQLELMADNIDIFVTVCDVSDKTQVDRMVADVTAHFGTIDILVNNAGTIQIGPIEALNVSDFRDAMDTIFFGQVNCILAVLPAMLARAEGQIVNISSIAGKISVPHLLPYNAAKFATIGLSEGLQAELANRGVSVTAIVPGLMRTGSYVNTFIKGQVEAEFAWFSVGDNLPFVSIDAGRAARQIVSAIRRRKKQHIITVAAVLLDALHRFFPQKTVQALGLVNRFLPSAEDGTAESQWGMAVYHRMHDSVLDSLLQTGNIAAVENHEIPGPINEIRPNSVLDWR